MCAERETGVGESVAMSPAADIHALADELLPAFYEDLRCIGRRERRRVGAGATMQTTALVNEAYLKLRTMKGWVDDRHFLCAASLAMRLRSSITPMSQWCKSAVAARPHLSLTQAGTQQHDLAGSCAGCGSIWIGIGQYR